MRWVLWKKWKPGREMKEEQLTREGRDIFMGAKPLKLGCGIWAGFWQIAMCWYAWRTRCPRQGVVLGRWTRRWWIEEQAGSKTHVRTSLAKDHTSFPDRWLHFLFSINSSYVNDHVSLFAVTGSVASNSSFTVATVGKHYSLNICVSIFSLLPRAPPIQAWLLLFFVFSLILINIYSYSHFNVILLYAYLLQCSFSPFVNVSGCT